MRTDHYQGNQIDEQIQRAISAIAAGIDTEEVIETFVASGIPREDAFLSVTAAKLSVTCQDILLEGMNNNASRHSQG